MTNALPSTFQELIGYDLGTSEIAYTERDAILYALACGAKASDLSLVYERDLKVLPGYACALGLWAVEKTGALGVYDPKRSLHASQSLVMHAELPRSGRFESRGKVVAAWDKGKATIVEIEVTSQYFTLGYSIFLPGVGGWGGSNTPAKAADAQAPELQPASVFVTSEQHAALYRLTGDLHPIHIDTDVAKANGFERPILHGLCTLGIALREVAENLGVDPTSLQSMSVRLSAPVLPGAAIAVSLASANDQVRFEAYDNGTAVLKDGVVTFK